MHTARRPAGRLFSIGDKKCSKVENCNESAYGICKICNDGFYLDKNDNKCNKQVENFINCKLSIDGNKCDECIDEYFLNEELKCVNTNYCKVANKDKCEECNDGYLMTNKYDFLIPRRKITLIHIN